MTIQEFSKAAGEVAAKHGFDPAKYYVHVSVGMVERSLSCEYRCSLVVGGLCTAGGEFKSVAAALNAFDLALAVRCASKEVDTEPMEIGGEESGVQNG